MTEQSNSPTLRQVQATVDSWIRATGAGYFSPLTNTAVLAEETGEVARLMARLYGDQNFRPGTEKGPADLADEMADVIWVLAALANQTGIDLSEAFARNLDKKNQRDLNRHNNKQITN